MQGKSVTCFLSSSLLPRPSSVCSGHRSEDICSCWQSRSHHTDSPIASCWSPVDLKVHFLILKHRFYLWTFYPLYQSVSLRSYLFRKALFCVAMMSSFVCKIVSLLLFFCVFQFLYSILSQLLFPTDLFFSCEVLFMSFDFEAHFNLTLEKSQVWG